MLKEKEFLEAFKEEFTYQLRRKFGGFGILISLVYISLLCVFTHFHMEILLILLTTMGYALLSKKIGLESMRSIYHRRRELDENPKGFREVEDFTFFEKLKAYLIFAFTLPVIFAGSMFSIDFFRTGELSIIFFIGMWIIPIVILYDLRKEKVKKLQ